MDPLLRIIDANANRAREALRVLEDAARFGRDDAPVAGRLKALRHDLRAALAPLDPVLLIAHRDTDGDVGREVRGSGEYERDGLRGVALAAGSRLGEAQRSIEEAAKALGRPEVAAAIERCRYAGYTAAKDVAINLPGRRTQWRLGVLVTEALCRHHPWDEVARRAVDGGADYLQLREKGMEKGELARRVRRLVEIARPSGVTVVVNDHADVALAAGADGVHVGQSDLSLADVRAIAGGRLIVGVSTERIEQAVAAAGAEYCGVGPMFPTATKHKPRLAGPAYLREFLAHPALAGVPHLAIGGITPDTISRLADAGCRGVAVSSCVCGAERPEDVCRSLAAALPSTGSGA